MWSTDLWHDICTCASKVASLGITHKKIRYLSVYDEIHYEFLEDLFHLPMSHQAYGELQQVEDICLEARETIHNDNIDLWSYILGEQKKFFQEGIHYYDWFLADTNTFQLDMEILMSIKAQVFLVPFIT